MKGLKMNALKLSGGLSFLFLLQSLVAFLLGTDFYYLVGFSAEKIATLNSPLTSDLAGRVRTYYFLRT
jgi:hypothetical protein